jgi:SAM-dependent methyltransferase
MHRVVLDAYFDAFRRFPPPGLDVLELGSIEWTAKRFRAALPADTRYLGINLEGDAEGDGWRIVLGTANDLDIDDASQNAIICNAMLEHDPAFWRSISEANRVLRPGGLLYLGVSGFSTTVSRARVGLRLEGWLDRVGRGDRIVRSRLLGHLVSTQTIPLHEYPGDYWRVSLEAMRRVLLADLEVLELREVHHPPRIFGVGRKPGQGSGGSQQAHRRHPTVDSQASPTDIPRSLSASSHPHPEHTL